ncbi:MAG: ammonium transporter [Geminicoccaceae bacterium]
MPTTHPIIEPPIPVLKRRMPAIGVFLSILFCSQGSMAQEAAAAAPGVAPETAYILNTLLFLIAGFLVMFMAAGFAMLEAGLVRKRSVGVQCLKNVSLFAISGIMFYLVGYNLMYSGVDGGYMGIPSIWSPDDSAALAGDFSGGYAASSDWFFQMVFVATAASIVSGTLAERIKIWPFLGFVVLLTGLLYPITGAWQWGGGWLAERGFADFAGSTLVHSVGGWAALAGVLLLGARAGRFGRDGRSHPMPGSSLPLATLGTFILWLGWFGFNGGSQLAMGTGADAIAIANIFINTNIAACGGVVAAMLASRLQFGKIDLTLTLNGAIGGLVSITAEPLAPGLGMSLLVGAIGGVLVVVTVPILDKLRIDDVVGAIPAHLVCGIWGTLAVAISNADATFATQALGVVSVGAFTFICSLVIWFVLRMTVGIRIHEEDEATGIDQAEIGMEAYPEFGPGGAA